MPLVNGITVESGSTIAHIWRVRLTIDVAGCAARLLFRSAHWLACDCCLCRTFASPGGIQTSLWWHKGWYIKQPIPVRYVCWSLPESRFRQVTRVSPISWANPMVFGILKLELRGCLGFSAPHQRFRLQCQCEECLGRRDSHNVGLGSGVCAGTWWVLSSDVFAGSN